jgi:radical SAM superfamily enzyme YgiQ (UPF0313 family)
VKIFLADLAHTYSTPDRSIPIPLGIGYVKAYADTALGKAADIKLFKHPDRFLAAVHRERPDVIGFANYGWNENLNREIGRHVRAVRPDALIVAGGPNIDDDPKRRVAFLRKHSYLDYLIIDGGEEPFTELVQWRLSGSNDRAGIPANVIWLDGDGLGINGERPLKKIIEGIPSPYLTGCLDEFIEAGMIPLFETNRGCPFKCTFCAWGSASKDLVRRFDLDQALAEIAYVGERSDARNWIICDANFGILPRDVEIAKAIRHYKDKRGRPDRCHLWLAKNVTERNLEIGGILNEMIVPVMAIQSMDPTVLKSIKRDNISLDTYEQYQQKFHKLGSRTYSDLIVPMPHETLATHLEGLRKLVELGCDIVTNNNMRMLAGAEVASENTRRDHAFQTKYRLIHGDAGIYRAPDGSEIRTFEYEESLRSTSTMSEPEVFYLRKLHFLVDFCWNNEVYRPLLNLALVYDVNPIDVFVAMIKSDKLAKFFAQFDTASNAEWFGSAEEIESYFAEPKNFDRLLQREFEKLNIQYAIIALRHHKEAFDETVIDILSPHVPPSVLQVSARIAFAAFPQIEKAPAQELRVPDNLLALSKRTREGFDLSSNDIAIPLHETKSRQELRTVIVSQHAEHLSKYLNTQHIYLSDLKLVSPSGIRFDRLFLDEGHGSRPL